jgi:hypothetical protein
MATNVSTRRELMTFSRVVWELSGNIDERDVEAEGSPAPPEVEGSPNRPLLEEVIELARGRFPGRIVGADPAVRLVPELMPKLPERLTREPALLLPLISANPYCPSSPTPSFDRALRSELAEIRLLRFRERLRSKSSARCPWAVN